MLISSANGPTRPPSDPRVTEWGVESVVGGGVYDEKKRSALVKLGKKGKGGFQIESFRSIDQIPPRAIVVEHRWRVIKFKFK